MVIINDEFPSLYLNYKLGYTNCQEKCRIYRHFLKTVIIR